MRLLAVFAACFVAGYAYDNHVRNVPVVPMVQSPSEFTLPPPRPPQLAPIIRPAGSDCSSPTLGICSQVAWTDFSLALSGLRSKADLCRKYLPSTSCVSNSLAKCGMEMEHNSRRLLIAIARVLVSWCYDDGSTLIALESQNECYAAAILQAITMDKCLLETTPLIGIGSGYFSSKASKAGLSLSGMLNGLMGKFGEKTIKCMYESISLTCGKDAAKLALEPAMDEFLLRMSTQEPLTIVPNLNDTSIQMIDENGTIQFYQKDIPAEQRSAAFTVRSHLVTFSALVVVPFLVLE